MPGPVRALAMNGAAQLAFSALLGWVMLVPRQPWAPRRAARIHWKALSAAHVDWIVLGTTQLGAAFVLDRWPVRTAGAVAALLVVGGWLNPLAYVFRAFGIDAFVFAGRVRQRAAAAVVGASSIAVLVGWVTLLVSELSRGAG